MSRLMCLASSSKHCRPDAILATNTSSLSITEIASKLKYKERVVGCTFCIQPGRHHETCGSDSRALTLLKKQSKRAIEFGVAC